jgi:hypothetical protein
MSTGSEEIDMSYTFGRVVLPAREAAAISGTATDTTGVGQSR